MSFSVSTSLLSEKDATRFTAECLTAIDMIPKGLTPDPNAMEVNRQDPDRRLRLSRPPQVHTPGRLPLGQLPRDRVSRLSSA